MKTVTPLLETNCVMRDGIYEEDDSVMKKGKETEELVEGNVRNDCAIPITQEHANYNARAEFNVSDTMKGMKGNLPQKYVGSWDETLGRIVWQALDPQQVQLVKGPNSNSYLPRVSKPVISNNPEISKGLSPIVTSSSSAETPIQYVPSSPHGQQIGVG